MQFFSQFTTNQYKYQTHKNQIHLSPFILTAGQKAFE